MIIKGNRNLDIFGIAKRYLLMTQVAKVAKEFYNKPSICGLWGLVISKRGFSSASWGFDQTWRCHVIQLRNVGYGVVQGGFAPKLVAVSGKYRYPAIGF